MLSPPNAILGCVLSDEIDKTDPVLKKAEVT